MDPDEEALGTAFNDWVDSRLEVLRDILYPLYFGAYEKHGKGMVVLTFGSVEEIKQGKPAPTIFFAGFPEEMLPVHERLKQNQGKGWLPMLAVVPFEGQTKMFAGILLGWGTPKKITRMVMQRLHDGDDFVYVRNTRGGSTFCVM